MTKEVTSFWGCVIDNKFPFMEYLTRVVLEKFDYSLSNIKGASCCPDPVYSKALGKDKWLALAARNLAIAEETQRPLLVACNGCWNTLKTASIELQNQYENKQTQETLSKIGRKYTGQVELVHILQLLKNEIGMDEIKTSLVRSLRGMRGATFLGCHATSPTTVAIDSDDEPTLLDEFCQLLGIETIDYPDKSLCCGGPAIKINDATATQLLRRKLSTIKEAGADAIIVTCPTCFAQFDRNAPELNEDLTIPVFHLLELIGLAIGIPPSDLTFDWHRIPVNEVLQKVNIDLSELDIIEKNFVLHCLDSQCEACRHECTAAQASFSGTAHEFDPLEIVQKLSEGQLTKVLESEDIWKCVSCHKCEILCPANRGLEETFAKLRALARKRGITPKIVSEKIAAVEATGIGLPKISDDLRDDIELSPVTLPDKKEIEKILKMEK